jgi:molybdenum cofactor cytidylyltransferase
MVRYTVEAVCAAGLDQVIAVVGAQSVAVREALANLPVEIVVNELWSEGMAGSVHRGINALRPDIQAVLLVLADQPTLTPDLIQSLVSRYRATRAPIVAPFFRGRRGNPVLFDRALFPELLTVGGDQGGRDLLIRYQHLMERVDTEDPAITLDIDTHQDYERLQLAFDEKPTDR